MTKTRQKLEEFHRRVIAGDPVVSSELFIATHKALARVFYQRFRAPGLSWEDAADLATDAIVAYLGSPHRFDPGRASLFTYLVLVGNADALNFLRGRHREQKNLARLVELSGVEGNVTDERIYERIDAQRFFECHIDKIAVTDMDRSVLYLMLQGEKETAKYAEALEITHLSPPEQRNKVKQYRDKISKRLERVGECG